LRSRLRLPRPTAIDRLRIRLADELPDAPMAALNQ